jgi:hypothetical protein
MESARAYSSRFWAKVELARLFDSYTTLAKDSVVPLFAILVFLLIDSRRAAARPLAASTTASASAPLPPAPGDSRVDVPWHEVIAALGFLALPLVGLLLAQLATGGAFTTRYTLPSVIGASLLLAYAGARFGDGRAVPGVAMAAILLGWFLNGEMVYHLRGVPKDLTLTPAMFAPVLETDLPVVVTRSITFLQADSQLPRPLSDRLVYLTSKGEPTDDRALTALSRWTHHLDIHDFDAFVRAHDSFFAFGSPNEPTFRALLEAGGETTLLRSGRFRGFDAVLVRISRRGNPSPATTTAGTQ